MILVASPHIILFDVSQSDQEKHDTSTAEVHIADEIQWGQRGTRRKEDSWNNQRKCSAYRWQMGQGKQSCTFHERNSIGPSLRLFQLRGGTTQKIRYIFNNLGLTEYKAINVLDNAIIRE